MNEIPLIWTSKGNLPVDELTYETRWEDTDDYTALKERYLRHGEVVKESVHVLSRKGISMTGETNG